MLQKVLGLWLKPEQTFYNHITDNDNAEDSYTYIPSKGTTALVMYVLVKALPIASMYM